MASFAQAARAMELAIERAKKTRRIVAESGDGTIITERLRRLDAADTELEAARATNFRAVEAMA